HKYITSILCTHAGHTQIYTLSLHDALPILRKSFTGGVEETRFCHVDSDGCAYSATMRRVTASPRIVFHVPDTTDSSERSCESKPDRKSTRLNSSHDQISYAVFCLKKKNQSQ